ncbi:MAG: TonB-dependent receptor, partial [Acidobacteria bacterium]
PNVNLDALRPYKGYNSIRETDDVASSRYNSLQLSWNRRFSAGWAFGMAYTLSKSMDDGSAQRDIVPDTYYVHNLWVVINYLYELPFFRGQSNLLGKLVGGWQLSGITQFQTGLPGPAGGTGSVAAGNDYAGVGQDGSLNGNGQFWVINGTPTILHQFAANGSKDNLYWFSTTNPDGSPIFTAPPKGTFNHQDGIRNIIHNPGFQNWNMGLFKKFPVTERTGLQFRAQAFNVFNHPNWDRASFNPTNLSTFGKITGKTNDVRNLQFSLRYYF